MPVSTWSAAGRRFAPAARCPFLDVAQRTKDRAQVILEESGDVAGNDAGEHVDRGVPCDLAQTHTFVGHGHEKRPAPGASKRGARRLDSDAVSVSLQDG